MRQYAAALEGVQARKALRRGLAVDDRLHVLARLHHGSPPVVIRAIDRLVAVLGGEVLKDIALRALRLGGPRFE